jgi:hypothetical protein
MDGGNLDGARQADGARGVGVDTGAAGAEAASRERKVPAASMARVAPTWAQGSGIAVTFAEVIEGRIVLTLEDGTKVMAAIMDVWRP